MGLPELRPSASGSFREGKRVGAQLGVDSHMVCPQTGDCVVRAVAVMMHTGGAHD